MAEFCSLCTTKRQEISNIPPTYDIIVLYNKHLKPGIKKILKTKETSFLQISGICESCGLIGISVSKSKEKKILLFGHKYPNSNHNQNDLTSFVIGEITKPNFLLKIEIS
jgi:ssDNA-binding Zn-finger/Zn-ribbon topoisomerase 1